MRRAQVQGFGDAAATAHVLATQAAMDVLGGGGNAVDAAVAANAVMGVVAPETCGVGGDLFALVWVPGAEAPAALNASGRAGSGADPGRLRREGHLAPPPFDPQSVTVPGCVYGWDALLSRFGQLSWTEVLGPAIRLAADGFPASPELCRAFAARVEQLAPQPAGHAFYPDGRPPRPGHRIRRPQLAGTLRAILDGGAEAFYRGEPGAAICRALEGVLTPNDLERNQAQWVEPLSLDLFGSTAWTVPPNSQGYLTLATLGIFERLGQLAPDTPEAAHLLIEAYRSVAWERELLLSDPVTGGDGAASILDPRRLSSRAADIDPDHAGRWPRPVPASGGTTYLCVLDRSGIGISLIQSNFWGIGAGIGASDAGFFLHNRGHGFTLEPGHPNELATGRRPMHTLAPTLWTRQGSLAALLGTRGGHQQPQILAQVAAHALGARRSVERAQAEWRWTLDTTTQARPVVQLESRTPDTVVAHLADRGHEVAMGEEFEPGWGPVSLITVDPAGLRTAGADPRVSTTAAAVR